MVPGRKPYEDRSEREFGPWTAARFNTQTARDAFLTGVATLEANDVEGVPMPQEACGALVRWRPGRFLGVNDLAHANDGRIILPASRQRRS
jgi:hypothetical protein